jgi:hypothetical protein
MSVNRVSPEEAQRTLDLLQLSSTKKTFRPPSTREADAALAILLKENELTLALQAFANGSDDLADVTEETLLLVRSLSLQPYHRKLLQELFQLAVWEQKVGLLSLLGLTPAQIANVKQLPLVKVVRARENGVIGQLLSTLAEPPSTTEVNEVLDHEVLETIAFLVQIRDNVNLPIATRLQAAEKILLHGIGTPVPASQKGNKIRGSGNKSPEQMRRQLAALQEQMDNTIAKQPKL